MNRRGFANIALIILIVVLTGVFAYVTLVKIKKPVSIERPQTKSLQNTQQTAPPSSNNELDDVAKIEKLLNEIPLTKINTAKEEYENLSWNRYENKEIGFEIYYPGNWKVSETKDRVSTSDEPPYMGIFFAPKTFSHDFMFALYVDKRPMKESLAKVADRGWLPIEKLQVNNVDAVIIARYSEEDKRTYKNVAFGPDNWTIDFVSWSNNPVVYEQMFKSFRLLTEK